ncbi:MAG: hypothetical protein M1150_02200 [Patescibacteria group bacterium]|nr:hypothetical protein [Patescibacteria group bacterium]MCL5411526.1 hypothetical protein [Patescibacteria group bacterium]
MFFIAKEGGTEIEIHLEEGETREDALVAIAQASFELAPAEKSKSGIASQYYKTSDILTRKQALLYMRPPETNGYQVLCLPIIRGRFCITFIDWLAEYFVLTAWMYERERKQQPWPMLERAKVILSEGQTKEKVQPELTTV